MKLSEFNRCPCLVINSRNICISFFNSLTKSFEYAGKKLVGKLKCRNIITNKDPGNPSDEICSLSNNGITVEEEEEDEEEEEEDASKFDVKLNPTMPCSSSSSDKVDDGNAHKNSLIENETVRVLGEASTSVQQDPFCCGMDNPDNVKIRKRRNVQINPDMPCTCTYSDSEDNETGVQEDKQPSFMECDATLSRLRGIRFSHGVIEVDFLIV
ncbi:hypothetical protein ACOSQ3_018177 [Xanthoceras sorbifolium]